MAPVWYLGSVRQVGPLLVKAVADYLAVKRVVVHREVVVCLVVEIVEIVVRLADGA